MGTEMSKTEGQENPGLSNRIHEHDDDQQQGLHLQGQEGSVEMSDSKHRKNYNNESHVLHNLELDYNCSDEQQPVLESSKPSLFANFTSSIDSNSKFLLGNLDNLPASARKLFSMGKMYLNKERYNNREQGYAALFKPLPRAATEGSDNLCCSSSEQLEKEENFPMEARTGQKARVSVPRPGPDPVHCVQTYVQWRAAHDMFSMYSLCLPVKNVIYLQPIDDFPVFLNEFNFRTNSMKLSFFEMLQGFMQIFFSGMEVVIQPPVSVCDLGGNVKSRFHETTNQKQYCVTDLYSCLLDIKPRDGRCIVGISWTDLFPEGFNFVLGEASNTHKAAVVSFGRFETTGFDPETHQDISEVTSYVVWKLIKTISHEICHLFGFTHCTFFLCAMNESSSVSQALSQPLFLCPVCLRKLQKVCGFDIVDRYHLLHRFLANVDRQMDDCQFVKDAVTWLNTCLEFLRSQTD